MEHFYVFTLFFETSKKLLINFGLVNNWYWGTYVTMVQKNTYEMGLQLWKGNEINKSTQLLRP